MELTFLNGNDLQKSACRTVAHNLLNLPFDSIPLSLSVEFVEDPLAEDHDEFAATTWSFGSTVATTRIASVAPKWPHPWNGVRFLQEVFAHELAHALYASLTSDARLAIAEMFGAEDATLGSLSPESRPWEDRIIEGIAETFKDAFLPQRFRRYSNRTNRTISISRYPEFRRIFRNGLQGGLGPNATAVGGLNIEGETFQPLDEDPEGEGLLDYETFVWTLLETEEREYRAQSGARFERPLSTMLDAGTGMWAPEEDFFLPPKGITPSRWEAEVQVRIMIGGFIYRRTENFQLRTFEEGEEFIIRRSVAGKPGPAGAAVQRSWAKLEGLKIISQESKLFSTFVPGSQANAYGGTLASILEEILEQLGEELSFDPDEVVEVQVRGEIRSQGNFDDAGMSLEAIRQFPMIGPGLGVHPLYVGSVDAEPIVLPSGQVNAGPDSGGRVPVPHRISG